MSITSIPMLYKIYMYHKGPLMVQNVEDELYDQLDGLGRVKQRDQLVVCQTSRYYMLIKGNGSRDRIKYFDENGYTLVCKWEPLWFLYFGDEYVKKLFYLPCTLLEIPVYVRFFADFLWLNPCFPLVHCFGSYMEGSLQFPGLPWNMKEKYLVPFLIAANQHSSSWIIGERLSNILSFIHTTHCNI
jgi:hypothetical protein